MAQNDMVVVSFHEIGPNLIVHWINLQKIYLHPCNAYLVGIQVLFENPSTKTLPVPSPYGNTPIWLEFVVIHKIWPKSRFTLTHGEI